jgi:hypothetical protein
MYNDNEGSACSPNTKKELDIMAKKTKEVKEFAWDTETQIGEFGDSKTRNTVNICTLNGKTYVQNVKEVMTAKNGWKRTKGTTVEMSVFKELQHIVGEWELGNAFSGSEDVKIEPKPSGGLNAIKAKHTAKGSAPSVLRGQKLSIREKLEGNENFGSLPKEKQDKVIKQAEAMHSEFGMVSVGMSKTNVFVVWGKGQIEAEKEIKKTKGFARAQVSYIP